MSDFIKIRGVTTDQPSILLQSNLAQVSREIVLSEIEAKVRGAQETSFKFWTLRNQDGATWNSLRLPRLMNASCVNSALVSRTSKLEKVCLRNRQDCRSFISFRGCERFRTSLFPHTPRLKRFRREL